MIWGKYSIRVDNKVMIIHCYGSWNAVIARQFIAEFKETARYLYHAPWAHIVFFDDWVLSTPDCEQPINDMLTWACQSMGLQQFDGFMVHLGGLHVRSIEWNRDYATVERHAPLGDGAVGQADNRQARADARGNQRRVAGGGHAGNGAYTG